MTIAVPGLVASKRSQSSTGSEMKKASVSTKMARFTVGGRISWMKSFIRPAMLASGAGVSNVVARGTGD